MIPRKICVVTGTRAEFGLLYWIMRELRDSPDFNLQILVTGSHLSPEFGMTVSEIEEADFQVSKKVEILLSSDTSDGICKSMGLGLIGFSQALAELNPDLMMVLGDRFEALSAVTAGLVHRIPIAHFHGGELTEGAIDDSMRHAITKMSHLHFTSHENYRKRVIQLGESPNRVFNVGAPGLENIARTELLGRTELEDALGRTLTNQSLLITFHPVTADPGESRQRFGELLKALAEFPDHLLIFTMPNADMEGRALSSMVAEFCAERPDSTVSFQSMGRLRYLSALKHVTAVVGNSSSGIIEAPSFQIGTVNIGDRQKGRLAGQSVLNCTPHAGSILDCIRKAISPEFRESLKGTHNPYGNGRVTAPTLEILKSVKLEGLFRKHFYDIPLETPK